MSLCMYELSHYICVSHATFSLFGILRYSFIIRLCSEGELTEGVFIGIAIEVNEKYSNFCCYVGVHVLYISNCLNLYNRRSIINDTSRKRSHQNQSSIHSHT